MPRAPVLDFDQLNDEQQRVYEGIKARLRSATVGGHDLLTDPAGAVHDRDTVVAVVPVTVSPVGAAGGAVPMLPAMR